MPPKGKRHTCGHCQESFPNKLKLQAHLATHDEATGNDLDMSVTESETLSGKTSVLKSPSSSSTGIVASLPDKLRDNLLNSYLPSPISSTLLKNQTTSNSDKVKDEIEALKFKRYKCEKCDKPFTTAGSHKRHQSQCKATTKIIPVEDDMDSEDMEDHDIESVNSSSDDEMTFASSSFQSSVRAKMTGNISRRVNSLLKEKKAKMVSCKVCKSKYNKDFGECKKCKINELKKKAEQKNTPKPKEPEPIKEAEEVCISCGEICLNKEALLSHQISCDAFLKDKEEKEKENVQSDENFSTPEKMNEGSEECATCLAKFDNKVALLEHLASHTGAMEKTLMCGICQKTFSRKYHLDRHLLMTACSGQPPPSHTCQVCGKAYTRKDIFHNWNGQSSRTS